MDFGSDIKYSINTIRNFYKHSRLVQSNEFDFINGVSVTKNTINNDDNIDSNETQVCTNTTTSPTLIDEHLPLSDDDITPSHVENNFMEIIDNFEQLSYSHKDESKSKKSKRSKKKKQNSPQHEQITELHKDDNCQFEMKISHIVTDTLAMNKAFKQIKMYKALNIEDQLKFLDLIDAIVLSPLYNYSTDDLNNIEWTDAINQLETRQWDAELGKINDLMHKYIANNTCANLLVEHKHLKKNICKKLQITYTSFVFVSKLT